MSDAWAEKTYEAAADKVADELSMLRDIILSSDNNDTTPSCDEPSSDSGESQ